MSNLYVHKSFINGLNTAMTSLNYYLNKMLDPKWKLSILLMRIGYHTEVATGCFKAVRGNVQVTIVLLELFRRANGKIP